MSISYPALFEQRTPDLDLAKIQVRYADDDMFPSLITKYELFQPISLADASIDKILNELNNSTIGAISVRGLFVLGIANFESMLGDLIKKLVSFFPPKINMLPNIEAHGSHGISLMNGSGKISTLTDHIDLRVNKLLYDNLKNIIKKLSQIFSIDGWVTEVKINRLTEIKETRNLLLHNNLIVNSFYLEKAGEFRRAEKPRSKLQIDHKYAIDSMLLIKEIIRDLKGSVSAKYDKFTFIELMRRLWKVTFPGPVNINDHLEFDTEADYFSGHFKDINRAYASSEIFYLQFWKGQREGSSIERFAFVHITSTRVAAFLTEVFGALYLPYA